MAVELWRVLEVRIGQLGQGRRLVCLYLGMHPPCRAKGRPSILPAALRQVAVGQT